MHPLRMKPAAANCATGSAGAAATVTKSAPGTGKRWTVTGVYWSYTAAPTGGRLTLNENGTAVMDFDITAAGPGFIPFERPMSFGDNMPVTLVLAAPGGAVVGKCGFIGAWTEQADRVG